MTSAQLDNIPGAHGKWDGTGMRLDLGANGEPSRLHVGSGSSSLTVYSQNGSDGRSATGVVTGARFTINGPLLSIGGKEYSLSDVTEVHVPG